MGQECVVVGSIAVKNTHNANGETSSVPLEICVAESSSQNETSYTAGPGVDGLFQHNEYSGLIRDIMLANLDYSIVGSRRPTPSELSLITTNRGKIVLNDSDGDGLFDSLNLFRYFGEGENAGYISILFLSIATTVQSGSKEARGVAEIIDDLLDRQLRSGWYSGKIKPVNATMQWISPSPSLTW